MNQIKQRKMLTLTPEMARRVDDYRFERRFRTKAEALARLIEIGLNSDSATQAQ